MAKVGREKGEQKEIDQMLISVMNLRVEEENKEQCR